MSETRFAMGEAVAFGWETAKSNIGFFIGVLVVAMLIQIIPRGIGDYVAAYFPLISVVFYIIAAVLEMVVGMGIIKISLKFCDGTKGKLDDLLSSFHLVIKYFLASLLYLLIVTGGLILLVIPGIIWCIKYSLFPYFIVDEGLGPLEAIKASGRATQDAKWQLFLFGLLIGIINIAGVLALFVGIFITFPLSLVAYAYVYRKLAGKGTVNDTTRKEVVSGPIEGLNGVMYVNLES
jgi:uncharacterized membrane protein